MAVQGAPVDDDSVTAIPSAPELCVVTSGNGSGGSANGGRDNDASVTPSGPKGADKTDGGAETAVTSRKSAPMCVATAGKNGDSGGGSAECGPNNKKSATSTGDTTPGATPTRSAPLVDDETVT